MHISVIVEGITEWGSSESTIAHWRTILWKV